VRAPDRGPTFHASLNGVAGAPRQFTNEEVLFDRGAFAAVIDLGTGVGRTRLIEPDAATGRCPAASRCPGG
jgi:hypothetical protein